MHATAAPRLFATFPPSSAIEADYLAAVRDVARWSEDGGCTGALIYTDNSLVDPWIVAQEVLRVTERLRPLVAVQPVYMHPYSVAKMVATLGYLYGRGLDLNMVAGGFVNDLDALGDHTEHDARYDRLIEFTTIVQRLIEDPSALTLEGAWYGVKNLKLRPRLAETLWPRYLVSGSSAAGMAAARRLGATAVQYPRPASGYPVHAETEDQDKGIRIGIIAREDPDEAWAVAWDRFPGDERGRITHRLAMATSDSAWHQQLSQLGEEATTERPTYWLHPFENYKTFCPYLVGSHDDVADEVRAYLELGFSTFILDVPREPEDLLHAGIVFDRARTGVTAA